MNSQQPLKLDQNTWKTIDRNNKYFAFIEECRLKTYDEGTTLHVHHIIPKYVLNKTEEGKDYLNSDENLITLSDQNHLQAHGLLYEVYNNSQDRGACLLLQGQRDGAVKVWRTLGAEATHRIQRAKGGTVFNQK